MFPGRDDQMRVPVVHQSKGSLQHQRKSITITKKKFFLTFFFIVRRPGSDNATLKSSGAVSRVFIKKNDCVSGKMLFHSVCVFFGPSVLR